MGIKESSDDVKHASPNTSSRVGSSAAYAEDSSVLSATSVSPNAYAEDSYGSPVGCAPRTTSKAFTPNDDHWMQRALDCAKKAESQGEVPVGAVLVKDNQLIAEGWNQCITASDPSAHAEIMALRAAAKTLGNYRLPGTQLYVTLEPCTMCIGAMIHARVERLIYATADPKTGVVDTVAELTKAKYHNHQIQVTSGILQLEAAKMLKNFFQTRRGKSKS